jgi:hypothetical protein
MNLNALGLMETDDGFILLARMRHQRDRLLAESDWAMMPDAPTDKTEWAEYRQALRDFPATWTPGPVAEFPLTPGEEPAPTVEEVEVGPDVSSESSDSAGDPDSGPNGL